MSSTLGIAIDLVIVGIFLIFGIVGYKKGLLNSVLSLFGWGFCIAVACLTAKYVAGWINGLYDFSSLIGNGISKNLTGTNNFFAQAINTYESSGALIEASSNLKINSLLKTYIKILFSGNGVNMSSTKTIGFIVGYSLGNICMIIISAILIFIILKIATNLLTKFFKNIEQTKVLGQLNKILGSVLGVIKATLIIVAINGVMVGLSLIPPVNNFVNPFIQNNTYIEKVFYNSTDHIVEKYVIEGDLIKNSLSFIWNKK